MSQEVPGSKDECSIARIKRRFECPRASGWASALCNTHDWFLIELRRFRVAVGYPLLSDDWPLTGKSIGHKERKDHKPGIVSPNGGSMILLRSLRSLW